MITVAIFTFKRNRRLTQCLQSIHSQFVNEILLFNDDETQQLDLSQFNISDELKSLITIYNPGNFGFNDRTFRKPIYLNKKTKLPMAELHQIIYG